MSSLFSSFHPKRRLIVCRYVGSRRALKRYFCTYSSYENSSKPHRFLSLPITSGNSLSGIMKAVPPPDLQAGIAEEIYTHLHSVGWALRQLYTSVALIGPSVRKKRVMGLAEALGVGSALCSSFSLVAFVLPSRTHLQTTRRKVRSYPSVVGTL